MCKEQQGSTPSVPSPQGGGPPSNPDSGAGSEPVGATNGAQPDVGLAGQATEGAGGSREPVLTQLAAIAADVKAVREVVSCSARAIDERAGVESALALLAAQHRTLAEHFHEREVLQVVFLTLIRLADRARETQRTLGRDIAAAALAKNYDSVKQLTNLLNHAQLGLVDLESTLAYFDVGRYESAGDCLDPSLQECHERVPTTNSALHGRIAARLCPGYRRNGTLIRRERVTIYVCHAGNHPYEKGR